MVELLKLTDDVAKKKINISDFLDYLVLDALKKKASDIHIESKEDNMLLIRYRIDGVLHDVIPVGDDLKDSLLFIIKVRARLRTDIHFAPQDGKILFNVKKTEIDVEIPKEEEVKEKVEEPKEEEKKEEKKKGKKEEPKEEKKEGLVEGIMSKFTRDEDKVKDTYHVDARISILPVTHGEKVVIRLLSQANRSFGLTDLGFEETDLVNLEKAYREPYGLILVTGPTGSG